MRAQVRNQPCSSTNNIIKGVQLSIHPSVHRFSPQSCTDMPGRLDVLTCRDVIMTILYDEYNTPACRADNLVRDAGT